MKTKLIGLVLGMAALFVLATDDRPVVSATSYTAYRFAPVDLTALQMLSIRQAVTNAVNIDPAIIGHVQTITIKVNTNTGTARVFFNQ